MRQSRFAGIAILVVLVLIITTACAFTNVITQQLRDRATDAPPVRYYPEEDAVIPTSTSEPEIVSPVEEAQPFYEAGERVQFPAEALESLDSYHSQLNLRSVGQTEDETELVRELTVLEEQIRSEDAAHRRITGDGVAGHEEGALAFYRFNEQAYVFAPDSDITCMLYDAPEPDTAFSGALVPHEIFTSFEIEELMALNDEVDGVLAQHYTVQSVELTLGPGREVMGEIWIAQDGGQVVQFVGEVTGNFMLADQVSEGVLIWEYRLTEIDELQEIHLPSACQEQQASAEFPIPENAGKLTILSDFISFESPDTPLSVARFYRNRLPEAGWEILSDTTLGDLVQIDAEKEDRSVQIFISASDGGALVLVIE